MFAVHTFIATEQETEVTHKPPVVLSVGGWEANLNCLPPTSDKYKGNGVLE